MFFCCSLCGKVFWEGSHYDRVHDTFKSLLIQPEEPLESSETSAATGCNETEAALSKNSESATADQFQTESYKPETDPCRSQTESYMPQNVTTEAKSPEEKSIALPPVIYHVDYDDDSDYDYEYDDGMYGTPV